ncbi:type II and III secretion system protein family protein [Pirellulaceae bacterium SH501]
MGRGPSSLYGILRACAVMGILCVSVPLSAGEGDKPIPTGRLAITKQQESLRMIVTTSQYLSFPQPIVTATINNPTVLNVQATQKNEVLVSALATGVTQIDAKGLDETVYNVQVVVTGDARELQSILDQHFPTATLQVQPIRDAVIISGQVTADEHVEQVVTIAEEFYQRVINKIEVIGVHTIMLQTQVMEVSRTKLRQLGIDWSMGFGDDFVTTSASGLIAPGATTGALLNAGNETFKFGVVDSGNQFFGLVRALRQNNLAKVLADPTVVAIDGRPASFNSGGEFPIIVPAGLGQVGIEFREFGTRLDFVAKVRGDGRIWLEVRPTISEIDPGRSVTIAGTSVPGIRSRFVDTAVELRAGQTLALAGLLQVRTEAETSGIPGLADLPYLGALFRANREVQNEVELLILVTPNFAAPMDCHEVPAGGPGFNSESPLDKELYMKGYIEVPNTCGPEVCPPTQSQPGTILYGQASQPTDTSLSGSQRAPVPATNASFARPLPPVSRK